MPDMKLTPGESQAIASYLLSEQSPPNLALQPQEHLVALGKMHFAELNCAACHRLVEIPAKPLIGSLRKADLTRGCLSNSPVESTKVSQGKSPRFALNASQVDAIRAALKEAEHVDSDQVQIAKTLTVFNCIACHIRDDFGGVAEDRSPYFETSEKNLGEDGRIPPPLTLLGAKLRPEWLKKVLFDGESVRPYMVTRMPQYGEPNLRHFPDLVRRVDKLQSVELNIPSPESDTRQKTKEENEREKMLRTAGRELLGQQGVYCVACHNFNGKPAPVNKGIDLMTTFERLQPGWFNNFVRNPGKYRPRIVMPYSWPDGVAAHDKILDGNTQMQIEAIWYYLSLGTSAADPPGIRRVDTVLSVGDEARTYRGRSSVAGFRGIAVGFPEKLSYAFNAETGTLSAIWQGDFIRVDRSGQGSGGFNPSAQAIQLAQDVSFVALENENSPWPLRPVMSKEAPANPDPLYPKNHDYQFKGYYLDDSSVPTFMYRSGDVEIEDRSIAVQTDAKLQLVRTFQFQSPANRTLWFRALTGETEKLKAESKLDYQSDKLSLTIPDVPVVLRAMPDDAKQSGVKFSELLLCIEIPQGQSTLSLTYEPLKKQ
jgi:mono/diheme cytochrome c family protein